MMNYREPHINDAKIVYGLIKDSKILDLNSLYCYLIIIEHFSQTSIIAEDSSRGEIIGFISAYIPPEKPDVIFVWQVVVKDTHKGKGIAKSMILNLLKRNKLREVSYLETTVTPSNLPSKSLFLSVSKELNAECKQEVLFKKENFFMNNHEEEILYRIGPF